MLTFYPHTQNLNWYSQVKTRFIHWNGYQNICFRHATTSVKTIPKYIGSRYDIFFGKSLNTIYFVYVMKNHIWAIFQVGNASPFDTSLYMNHKQHVCVHLCLYNLPYTFIRPQRCLVRQRNRKVFCQLNQHCKVLRVRQYHHYFYV